MDTKDFAIVASKTLGVKRTAVAEAALAWMEAHLKIGATVIPLDLLTCILTNLYAVEFTADRIVARE